jgi:hypothetical protein
MLTFKCTKKVQDYLGVKPAELVCTSENKTTLLGAWYVNQLIIDRHKVFLFMNEKTLLSFISIGIKKTKHLREDFPSTFLYHFFILAKLLDFPLTNTGKLIDDYCQSEFRKTDNKSLLGNMNDLAFLYQNFILHDGGFNHCDLSEIILKVNQTPQRNLGWKNSMDISHEILSQPNRSM